MPSVYGRFIPRTTVRNAATSAVMMSEATEALIEFGMGLFFGSSLWRNCWIESGSSWGAMGSDLNSCCRCKSMNDSWAIFLLEGFIDLDFLAAFFFSLAGSLASCFLAAFFFMPFFRIFFAMVRLMRNQRSFLLWLH